MFVLFYWKWEGEIRKSSGYRYGEGLGGVVGGDVWLNILCEKYLKKNVYIGNFNYLFWFGSFENYKYME